ncbi:hypothetical protein GH714_001940 [Hevea brasiliensis]|uniref:Uncharacterized protein n=1 Tax=Hevea brasiliensis TaxID=3981 RepID=A0A6A6L8B5_HEVBR|nr:hypothetical protein GH714_001940 [Hevea brasiliensis]
MKVVKGRGKGKSSDEEGDAFFHLSEGGSGKSGPGVGTTAGVVASIEASAAAQHPFTGIDDAVFRDEALRWGSRRDQIMQHQFSQVGDVRVAIGRAATFEEQNAVVLELGEQQGKSGSFIISQHEATLELNLETSTAEESPCLHLEVHQ